MAIGQIGDVIGKLTVLKRKWEKGKTYCYCKCECGNEKWIRQDSLKTTRSCGCLMKNTQFKPVDITNKKFGKLTALEATEKREEGSIIWKCKCDCGNITYVAQNNLTCENVRSCGCLQNEARSKTGGKNISGFLKENVIENTNINALERGLISSNTSGVKGVHWDNTRKMWVAQIDFKKKHYFLGRRKNKEEAIQLRKEAEEKYHNNFLEWYYSLHQKGNKDHEIK